LIFSFFDFSILQFFVLRHQGELSEMKSITQENPHLEVPGIFLNETVSFLRDNFWEMKGELILKFDELGMSNFEDQKGRKLSDHLPCVIAAEMTHHDVDKNLKNISIIVSLSGGREFSSHVSSSYMILNLSAIV
jgi:hypothetical protein